ncbi:MAG TPA: hypothetical protein VFZ41_05650 [Solirubrobacterales bacterium]
MPSLSLVISRAAVEAVTSAENLSQASDESTGIMAVRAQEVVAELRRLEGLTTGEARRLGREAVIHVGGHVEPIPKGMLRPGRLVAAERREIWWVPSTAIRRSRSASVSPV